MKRILSLILCLSVLLSASVFSLVASAEDVAPEEPAWTEYVPTEISDAIQIGGTKGFGWMGYANAEGSVFTNVKATEDTSATYPLTNGLASWLGEITISSKDGTLTGPAAGKPVELFRMPYVQMGAGAGNSIMFYIEIPDYEKADATWAVGLSQMNYKQNELPVAFPSNISWDGITFSYLPINGSAWVTSDVVPIDKSEGNCAQLTLPSGFKGYIRLGPETIPVWAANGVEFDKTQPYTFNMIELALNSIGGECGDFVCGGIAYTTNNVTDSIYYYNSADKKYSKLTQSDTILTCSYAGYNESNSSNSTTDITLTGGNSAAVWDLGSAIFTSATGTAQTTQAKYTRNWSNVKMQPGVDTFMIYVEVPEFTGTACPLQLDYPEIRQAKGNGEYISYFLYPCGVTYKYMSATDGIWKTASAGYNGELNAIPSGFKGYIKFDIKDFDLGDWNSYYHAINAGFDFSKPYNIEQFRIMYNYAGGEDNPFVFGALYSVFADADSYIFTNSVVGTTVCAKEITGDLSGDGAVDATDLATGRRVLLGLDGFDAYKANRAGLNTDDAVFNIRDLVALKKLIAAIAQ